MKSPSPPDPKDTAAAQQAADMGASWTSGIINNPNIVNPYGTQTYSIAGYETVKNANGKDVQVPRYTQTQTLSPAQQKILDYNNQMQTTMAQAGGQQAAKLGKHLQGAVNPASWQAWNAGPRAPNLQESFGSAGKIQKGIGNQDVRQDTGRTDRRAIENAMMQNYTQDTAGQNAAMDAQMAARGLNPGSAQYGGIQHQRSLDRGRAVNEAYLASGAESREAQNAFNQAAAQRFGQGAQIGQFRNAAQEQQYNQLLGRAGFRNEARGNEFNMGGAAADRGNALRQAQMEQSFALRNQPINEIAALMAGGQVTMPQFSPYQGQGVNAAPIGQYIANNYAQQNAQAGAFNTGLFNLAGAGVTGAFGMSDRRMKFDIKPLGGDLAGAPLYTFRFRHDPDATLHAGVMADEVRVLHPDAVLAIDGIDHVNYGLLAARHGG